MGFGIPDMYVFGEKTTIYTAADVIRAHKEKERLEQKFKLKEERKEELVAFMKTAGCQSWERMFEDINQIKDVLKGTGKEYRTGIKDGFGLELLICPYVDENGVYFGVTLEEHAKEYYIRKKNPFVLLAVDCREVNDDYISRLVEKLVGRWDDFFAAFCEELVENISGSSKELAKKIDELDGFISKFDGCEETLESDDYER